MNAKKDNIIQKMFKNSFSRTCVVIFFILIISLSHFVLLRGEYLSIKSIGENYTDTFFRKLKIQYLIFGCNFLIIFSLFLIINKIIKKGLKAFFDDDKKEMPRLPNKSMAFIIAIISSFIAKYILSEKFMLINNIAWFGFNDPVFNNDISYYIFILPFIKTILTYSIGVFVFALVYTALYYVIALNTYLDGVDRELLKKSLFIKQIIFYVITIVLLFSTHIWVFSENILTQVLMTIGDSKKTELIGAGSVDTTIKFFGYRILSVVIFFAVVRLLVCIKKKNFKKGVIAVLIIPIYLIGLFVTMVYSSEIHMRSNKLDKEKDYIGYNINFTKNAYGIEINQEDIENYDTISRTQVEDNKDLLENIPFLSTNFVEKTLEQQQEDSLYYSYKNSRLAYYNINGKNSLIYITPREPKSSNRSYNNLTYEYTHGYSVMLSYGSRTDKNGYLEYPSSTLGVQNSVDLNITEPRIYFGLQTDSEIIVNSDYGKEYDYVKSAVEKQENIYDGNAGLKLGFWDRLALGIKNGNIKLAFSKYINDNSKIISERNILKRVNTILPSIQYDNSPYLVITDSGKLIWVIDGYTISDEYPYSQFTTISNGEKINYIRNSVKVLIDAYDGTTKYYITDRNDPIIMSYRNLYPNLFTEEEIPSDVSKHFVYPKMLYKVQSKMINLYHGISEDVLYRGDNVWQISTETSNKNSTVSPYYTLVNTINSYESTLGLVVPYSEYGKQSMTAYLVGNCENGKNKLNLYKFGSNTNVAGISQVNTQIEQDENISKVLQSLALPGTKIQKDMIVVPIENTLLYVENVYQTNLNEKDSIPTLKKVIVASGNVLAIGDSLNEAIMNLYTDYSVELDFYDAYDIDAIIDSIIKSNNNLNQSLESQNFEMIGKDLSSLRSLINQLEALHKKDTDEVEENSKVEEEQSYISENVIEE